MRVLVVYDSISQAKVTEKIAAAIVDGMKENGVLAEPLFIKDAGKANIKDFDCLVVGAPSMGWNPSERMRSYLDNLGGNDYAGKMAAVFDTQMWSNLSGPATAKAMEANLSKTGFNIISSPLICYVAKERGEYRLQEGELEKAMQWGKSLAKLLLARGS